MVDIGIDNWLYIYAQNKKGAALRGDVYNVAASLNGSKIGEYYETVSKNLKSNPYVFTYTDGTLTRIDYTIGVGLQITKTLNYTDGVLTSIVLSGDTPSGIDLTKTLNYTDGVLTSVEYS